jgi:hypothetical protein
MGVTSPSCFLFANSRISTPRRLARVTSALRNHVRFGAALALAVDSDVWQKRADFAARRVRDDDWLFEKFKDSCNV